jgi:hypothetical protein
MAVAASFASTALLATDMRAATDQPPSLPLAELWNDPAPGERNLFDGPGGNAEKPRADEAYEVEERDSRGFSIGYRVTRADGSEWSVKIGPEAQTEVISSRIVWALGYHQLPSYFVERWTAVLNGKRQTLGGARFRPRPRDIGLDDKGRWSWRDNPFVETREFKGLLSLMMILNSTDLKDDNNELYDVEPERRGDARRWYVVKDLGASLGETGRFDPRRGYIEGFERERFILGVDKGFVQFAFKGRHQELLRHITPDDVKWISARLLRLTDRQWHDAFRAGGCDEATTARYIARIKAKAAEGIALQ